MSRPARVIVNPNAVRSNFDLAKSLAPQARVMAIVKADGYGHGIARIANALVDRADAFGVASLEEAVQIREAGIDTRIVLLEGPFSASEVRDIEAYKLDSVIHSSNQIDYLDKASAPLSIWIKIDTGMHRLGFAPTDLEQVFARVRKKDHVIHFLTHFASAHEADDASVDEQMRAFDTALKSYEGERSVANSSAVLAWPQHRADWIRPGLMLYGVSPFKGRSAHACGLKPAMTVASELIAVREVEAGGSVGYGKAYVCPDTMPVGVVAFGYGDGYPRQASTGTPILVNGIRTQVIGEASMDMLTVDLRPIPNVQLGAPVELWGPNIPVEEVASYAATIPYELLCRVRMRARYVESLT